MILSPLVVPGGLIVSGWTLAVLGIGLTWADAGSEERTVRSIVAGSVTFVTITVSVPILVLVSIAVLGLPGIFGLLHGSESPILAILGVMVGGALTTVLLALSIPRLPLAELAPTAIRHSIAHTQRAVGRRFWRIALAFGIGSVLVVLGGIVLFIARVPSERLLPTSLRWLVHPSFVVPVLWITAILLGLALLNIVVQAITSGADASTRRVQAGIAVGFSIALLLPIWLLRLILEPTTVLLLGGAIAIGTPLLVLTGLVMLVGQWGQVVPNRSGAPAIAAGGLLVTAIGVGSSAPILTFCCVAGAVVVWGVCWNGLALTSELGHIPDTRRIELIHGVGALAVGIVSVGLAMAALTLLEGLARPGGSLGLAVVALGALMLLGAIRG
ncbi:MAG: hypothetical protein U5K37_13305 [Natrialbaceae archaeon]|nr:hypothetical protein [Natrialbaceae archaeon]